MENEEQLNFNDWRRIYSDHPQNKLLISHIERATNDIFYLSLKNEESDLFFFIRDKEQLDKFLNKMIKYWESKEEFEKCSEIIKIGEILKIKWDKEKNNIKLSPIERLNNWIKSTL